MIGDDAGSLVCMCGRVVQLTHGFDCDEGICDECWVLYIDHGWNKLEMVYISQESNDGEQ